VALAKTVAGRIGATAKVSELWVGVGKEGLCKAASLGLLEMRSVFWKSAGCVMVGLESRRDKAG
jgi:hypothetical protein